MRVRLATEEQGRQRSSGKLKKGLKKNAQQNAQLPSSADDVERAARAERELLDLLEAEEMEESGHGGKKKGGKKNGKGK